MPVLRRDITTEEKEWYNAIGRRIKAARKARGISQQDFAKMLDMSNSGLCHLREAEVLLTCTYSTGHARY